MKKIIYVFIIGLLFSTCVRERMQETSTEILTTNKLGQTFVRNLMETSGWELGWREIMERGTPLVDNVIIDSHDELGFYYLLPVLSSDGTIDQFVVYPMNVTIVETGIGIHLKDPVWITKEAVDHEKIMKSFITPFAYSILLESDYPVDSYFAPDGYDKLSRGGYNGEKVYLIRFVRNNETVVPWNEDPTYLSRLMDMYMRECKTWQYSCYVQLGKDNIKIIFRGIPDNFDYRKLDNLVLNLLNRMEYYLPEVLVVPDKSTFVAYIDYSFTTSVPEGLYMLNGTGGRVSVHEYLSKVNPPKPPVSVNHVDPCQYMADRRRNPLFKQKMDELKRGTSLPYEVVVYFTLSSGSGIEFTKEVGGENAGGVDFVVHDPIDGIIHTHNRDGLPVFSIDDLIVPYTLRQDGMMVDPKRFTMGLVTPKTTLFLFFDENVYYSWMQKNMGNLSFYSTIYESVYKITKDTPSDLAVENFERFLEQTKMGITLMEKDSQSDKYKRVEYKNGRVVRTECD